MGNSNSIGQFTPNEMDLRQRAHWQYLSQQQQQHHHHQQQQHQRNGPFNHPPLHSHRLTKESMGNNNSSSSNGTSIKVLPEMNDTPPGGLLRPTDNGAILFNGGTISGRRESSTAAAAVAAGVTRSKSISSPQHEYNRRGPLQRHKTQLDMPLVLVDRRQVNGGGLRREVDPKFGSEPDLRLSPAEGRNSRKQQAAGQQQQQQQQLPREYDSSRFGWRPKSHQPQGHGRQQSHHQAQQQQQKEQINQPQDQAKKPRLFKTREETKKANQSKLATEASDVVQVKKVSSSSTGSSSTGSRPLNNGRKEIDRNREDCSTTDRVIRVIGNHAPVPEKLLPKAEVLSKPVFRREKSFDISLLLSRGAQKGTSLFPNVFRKSSTTEKNAPPSATQLEQKPKASPVLDKTLKSRRSSQPPPHKDFQKELQEATRRRSMLVPLREENKASAAVQKSTIVTQSPVLKAISKPRPAATAIAAKENAKPPLKSKAKAPKPPQQQQSPKVATQNKIQLEIRNSTPEDHPAMIESLSAAATNATASAGGEAEVCAVTAEKPVKSFYYGMAEQQQELTIVGGGGKVNGSVPNGDTMHHVQVAGDVNITSQLLFNVNANANDTVGDRRMEGEVEGGKEAEAAEAEERQQKVELTAIESFTESIFAMKTKQQQLQPQRDSSESAVSSFADDALLSPAATALLYPNNMDGSHNSSSRCYDDTESLEGISLQLRPTLPKKQFEIPRFSPAAAWRLLSTADTAREVASQLKERMECQGDGGSVNSGDDDVANERNQETESRNAGEVQIERIYREPIPGLADNKSGDSGISGDGGLLELGDSSPTNNNLLANDLRKLGPFLQPWTPQQDLEDDSSSDPDPAEHGSGNHLEEGRQKERLEDVAQKHVFSLSLPRDSQVNLSDKGATSIVGEKHFFSSLQKTKMAHCYADRSQQSGNDNWFLGRSQPNSIEKSQPMPSLSDNEEAVSLSKIPADQQPAIQPPSFNYLAGGCHFMYLPNRPTTTTSVSIPSISTINQQQQQGTASLVSTSITRSSSEKVNNGPASVTSGPRHQHQRQRESLQDPEEVVECGGGGAAAEDVGDGDGEQRPVWNVPLRVGGRKGRRFTFQSTVRQIERRKIADKLSREAEEREAQRLSELEAMQKVEQEFQMKRAREKASIRQQLRLFSLEANQSNQCDADYSPSSIRREPDGAAESMGHGKMNSCHTTLASTSLLLELNGYQSMTNNGSSSTTTIASNTNILTRDYSKFPYREFLK